MSQEGRIPVTYVKKLVRSGSASDIPKEEAGVPKIGYYINNDDITLKIPTSKKVYNELTNSEFVKTKGEIPVETEDNFEEIKVGFDKGACVASYQKGEKFFIKW